jgi:Domain of unknown function (DUF4440)
MTAQDDVLAAEESFFQALLQGDGAALRGVLTPDFLLIDVMTGSEISGLVLVDLVSSRQLRFEAVERLDARVRLYGTAAVVTGQTRMQGRFGEQPFGAHSRYTHVYVHVGGHLAASVGSGDTDRGRGCLTRSYERQSLRGSAHLKSCRLWRAAHQCACYHPTKARCTTPASIFTNDTLLSAC